MSTKQSEPTFRTELLLKTYIVKSKSLLRVVGVSLLGCACGSVLCGACRFLLGGTSCVSVAVCLFSFWSVSFCFLLWRLFFWTSGFEVVSSLVLTKNSSPQGREIRIWSLIGSTSLTVVS